MKNVSGRLIAVEGIDGSGKSTICHAIAHALQAAGKRTVLTREPGATAFGQQLRTALATEKTIEPLAQFLTFAADRAHHVAAIIIPALHAGQYVISDRLADSSYVYQGIAQGVDTTMISQVNHWAMQGIKPDLTIFVTIDPTIALQRCAQRGTDLPTFERETIQRKAAAGFAALYANRTDVCSIDGTAAIEQSIAQVMQALQTRALL